MIHLFKKWKQCCHLIVSMFEFLKKNAFSECPTFVSFLTMRQAIQKTALCFDRLETAITDLGNEVEEWRNI